MLQLVADRAHQIPGGLVGRVDLHAQQSVRAGHGDRGQKTGLYAVSARPVLYVHEAVARVDGGHQGSKRL